MKSTLVGLIISIALVFGQAEIGLALTPDLGTIIGGAVVDRATQTPVTDASGIVTVSVFETEEFGYDLYRYSQYLSLTQGGFAMQLEMSPNLEPFSHLFLEFMFEHEIASPRLPLAAIRDMMDGDINLELLAFSRETPSSAIALTAKLNTTYVQFDTVDVTARVLDKEGNLLSSLGIFQNRPADGMEFSLNLPAVPGATLSAPTERILELTLDEARFGGEPVLRHLTYRIPLTYASADFCIELLHLLPPGSLPTVGGGSFGCSPSTEAPPEDGGEGSTELIQRVDQLEILVTTLQDQVANLEDAYSTLNATVQRLQATTDNQVLQIQTIENRLSDVQIKTDENRLLLMELPQLWKKIEGLESASTSQ